MKTSTAPDTHAVASPAHITFLNEFLNWSADDGRVGEVRHSALIDKARDEIRAFDEARSRLPENLKTTFESAAQTLWDAKEQFGGLVQDDAKLKHIAVLQAVSDRAEAEYMVAFYLVQYAKASDRWDEAIRNIT